MLLTLRPQTTAQRPASAAFLRGTDPAAWLRELSRWNLPASALACYLVPESIRSVRVAGLFVVAAGPLPPDVLEPYGAEADGRLFVPVEARLWPATAPGELAGALLWPRQLLHPGIGLVGFDTADELDLTALLNCPAPRPTDWNRARPGLAPRPRLQQVRVLQPTVAEVVEQMQEEVGTMPLAQLPGLAEDQPSPVRAALTNLHRRLLQMLLAGVKAGPGPPTGNTQRVLGLVALVAVAAALTFLFLNGADPGNYAWLIVLLVVFMAQLLIKLKENDGAATRPAPAAAPTPARLGQRSPGGGGPGPVQRLEKWLNHRIHNLEQKRQNEIERLLKLFGENLEEALKYAIPLGGPYQDRGLAPESAQLGPRSTDFNLGGLGGGGRADTWNLDDYRQKLTLHYGAAATQEIKAGRFKKAAYIYAHLLGDYAAAAQALERGGFCREAAALYKDHLNNWPAAAQCLENGGLLLEAAALYDELKEYEKAGDLYQGLDQPALAARHYERGVALLLDNDDHPAAARLLAQKLAAADRAQAVLLQGWAGPKQPEVCLRQYFDVLAATPETDLSAQVRTIFAEHTPRERRVSLLNVLATVNEKYPAPALLSTSRDIAYTVVSDEATAGNFASLNLLRHFLPDDRLIAADCSRFTSQPGPRAKPVPSPSAGLTGPQLDPSIQWKMALTHRHQWVAIGTRDERLHLARGNWYGHLEYYSWMTPVAAGTAVMLVADEQHGPRIIVRPSEVLALETKHLPKNKYFPEALTVECPSWLPPWPARVCLLPDGATATATAQFQGSHINVKRYSAEGEPQKIFYLTHNNPASGTGEDDRNWPSELLYRGGVYYSYWGNQLVQWADSSENTTTHELAGGDIQMLVCSPYAASLRLAIATSEGIQLWEPTSAEVQPGRVFSTEITNTDLQFVGPAHLAAVQNFPALQHYEIGLYHCLTGEIKPVRTIKFSSPMVAVLATINRQQFAVLEENGRITLHHISDEE